LVPRETREEVERLLSSNERYVVSTGPKAGNGRRPDRESEAFSSFRAVAEVEFDSS